MLPAALRLALLVALPVGAGVALAAEAAPVRAPPTRPRALRPLPVTRFGDADYVEADALAQRLDLKTSWVEPGRKLALADAASRAVLEADERDITVNGVRFFLGLPIRVRGGALFMSLLDAERAFTPLVRPGVGAAPPPAPRIIVLDPGHGGRDIGTENRAYHLTEKTLALDVALRLRKLLEAAGFKVVLTRDDDDSLSDKKDVDLALRADLANRAGADVFVSIHFNAAPGTRGTEVFWFAPRTLRSTDSWGPGVNDAFDESAPVNRFDPWNAALAAALQRELLRTLKTEDRGVKIAHWAVLRPLKCPGVLVEPAMLSDGAEARRVAQPAFRQEIAEALAAGIRAYAAALAPPGGKP